MSSVMSVAEASGAAVPLSLAPLTLSGASPISLAGLPDDIAPQIVLGFCDLDGSSLKALHALVPAAGHTASYHAISLLPPDADPPLRPAFCPAAGEPSISSVCSSSGTVVNICSDKEGGKAKVTLIAINAWLPEDQQANLAAALVELVAARQLLPSPGTDRAQGGCLYVLASTLLQRSSHAGVHTCFTWPTAEQVSAAAGGAGGLVVLPPGTQLQDNILALLHHMSLATGTRAELLLTPGYRPAAGSLGEAESTEGATQLVAALLKTLEDAPESAVAAGMGAGATGVLRADLARLGKISLQCPWFGQVGGHARHDGMYC